MVETMSEDRCRSRQRLQCSTVSLHALQQIQGQKEVQLVNLLLNSQVIYYVAVGGRKK